MNIRLDQTPDGVDLSVTGAWSDDARAALADGRADGLVLNYARGFHEPDLAFLAGLSVKRLRVLDRKITDLSPIYGLADQLVVLSVESDPRASLELDRLPMLRDLGTSWQQVSKSIHFARGLERLYLERYTEKDFKPLTVVPTLTRVAMKQYPRVGSLDGVEDLPKLAELGVFTAQRLEDVSALRRASPLLEILQFVSCRKVRDIEAIASCVKVKFLELGDGADLDTIAPLAALKRLERLYLWGTTRVLDDDLSAIAGLPLLRDFRMQSRRSYSPSVDASNAGIAERSA